MATPKAIRWAVLVLAALTVIPGSCIVWFHWPRHVLSERSPDGSFRVEIKVRTLFPANGWLEPRGMCLVSVRSLRHLNTSQGLPLPADFQIYESKVSILAEEGPDCYWAKVRWELEQKRVLVLLRGGGVVSIPLDPRQEP